VSCLGIDVGSSYLKIWHEDESGRVVSAQCVRHRGSPRKALIAELERLEIPPGFVCCSGTLQGGDFGRWSADGLLAEVKHLAQQYPRSRLLIMGAEKIELVHFDRHGHIRAYSSNPACAAGTGSFLDEQIARLGIDFESIRHVPLDEQAPMVATRCAVFAKTDLIHLQQEGHSHHALYNGLCRGLVMSGLKSVFGGGIPKGGDILLTGGLLANPHIRHYLLSELPEALVVDEPIFSRARGLCMQARLNDFRMDGFLDRLREPASLSPGSDLPGRLTLVKSSFPATQIRRSLDHEGNELWHDIAPNERFTAFLGVDVGSTSTKAVLADAATGAIRLDVYTKTAGDPVGATRSIFRSIEAVQASLGAAVQIAGCGSTGSGRKLVGTIIGADLIVNEISAHAKGAKTVDASVETIFEIGGQDSKFIRLEGGRIVDVNMNYVCAAGTGSFIEEQANTLGMSLDEISDAVMEVTPLPNSDRCTVFMNQEITRQLSSGYSRDRIMAGVLLAVIKNYLNRVVGNRTYSAERIVFQGATARNRGLVAALEQITGARVMVSPFCHVMGAYGASLLAGEKAAGASTFKGFSIPEVSLRETTCRGCENVCRITVLTAGSRKVSWGHLCGREPGSPEKRRQKNQAMGLRQLLLKHHAPGPQGEKNVFRVPALPLYEELTPLFTEIGRQLGIPIQIFSPGGEEIARELSRLGSGDFCYPIKVSMACMNLLLRTYPRDRVLLPHLIQEAKDPAIGPRSVYCPFITSLPSFYRSVQNKKRVLTPVLDLSLSPEEITRELLGFFRQAGLAGTPFSRAQKAVADGIGRLQDYRRSFREHGRRAFKDIPESRPVIVIFGRSYNLYHKLLNLGIPELVESLGYTVIPMDIVPDETSNAELMERFPDMYWYQGQRILRAAMTVRRSPNLFPLMLSNFSCGPDSFILGYFEEVSRDKPYLILELDEHGSATGYQTRIEAFCDMIEQYRSAGQTPEKPRAARVHHALKAFEKPSARIWIPQIHPYTPQLWASVLQRHGYDAVPTGEETARECALGKSLCRGSECLPAALTIGKFLSCLSDSPTDHAPDKNVLLMPRAEGPCRFGQYATLQSRILERTGPEGACILSPTSENGYQFLKPAAERDAWRALCLGDMLLKLRCRAVPYHPQPHTVTELISQAAGEIGLKISQGKDWKHIVRSLVLELSYSMDHNLPARPLVGIVGEIFVRLNTFSNQHVIDAVENAGGEAWVSPMSEWIHYVQEMLSRKQRGLKGWMLSFKRGYIHHLEEEINSLFSPLLDDRAEPPVRNVLERGERFVPMEFEGEAILTIGRAKLFAEQGADLVVNCSPFSCMPGRITSHLFQMHPGYVGVPVVNLFYDGIGDVSSQVGIYLRSITRPGSLAERREFSFSRRKAGNRSAGIHPAGASSPDDRLPAEPEGT
jgi:predicted CoA-substrate-specific enzyme activase